MATSLNVLISDKTIEKTDLLDKIADGEEAKAELSSVESVLDTLSAVQALRDGVLAQTGAQVAGAQAAVAPLQASSSYTVTSGAIATLLAAETLTEGGMNTVVGNTLPMTGTYAGYVTALGTAAGDVATKATAAAEKRIALASKRSLIDVRIEALSTYANKVETWLVDAKGLVAIASVQAQAGSLAVAWWAFHRAKAQLAKVTAASATALATAVSLACDDYATAYDEWMAATEELATAKAAHALAEAKLAQADGQVLAALVALVAAP